MCLLCKASRRSPQSNKDMDAAVPTTSGEEELQLQLALAMSKEEHDEEMKRQKADELKLQLAIEESKKTAPTGSSYSEVLISYSVPCHSAPVGSTVLQSACLSVCLSVCPRTYLWNHWTDLHDFLCKSPVAWSSPGGLRYIMYFRFYG